MTAAELAWLETSEFKTNAHVLCAEDLPAMYPVCSNLLGCCCARKQMRLSRRSMSESVFETPFAML